MTSPALVALKNAINTNTLDAAQRGALSTALDLLIPEFPTPDELSNSIPETEETLARDWIAALYTIQAGGGTPVNALARVVSPTVITPWPVPFQPGVAGKILFVADITPEVTGELLVSVNVQIISDGAGVPRILLGVVGPLTAVTGGTLLAPGLTLEATSVTPDFSTALPVATNLDETFDDGAGNPHTAVLTIASIPINATRGVRIGIVGFAADTSTQSWTALTGQISVQEQPLE
jgi:hypothetical protein